VSDGSAPRRVETDASVRFRLPIYEGARLAAASAQARELDPHDVTASVITEQYLAWLELLDQLNLDVAGEYLVMAATLCLIKSFAMLPHPELADTEEAEELKRDLVERLLEYQRYRRSGRQARVRARFSDATFSPLPASQFPVDENARQFTATIFDLVEAMARC